MRFSSVFLFLYCAAVTLAAVEIPFKSGAWSGTVDSKGAVLKKLAFKGKSMTASGHCTFEDFVMGDGGGKIELCEEFFKLRFEPLRVDTNRVVFSACGTGAFADLRVTKTYKFESRKPEFTVTWEYRNIGKKKISAGLRTRCFFRNDEEKFSTFYFPEKGKVVKEDYPGASLIDRWITDPGLAFNAFHGKSSRTGLLLLPPSDLLGTLFCYFSQVKVLNTQEYFLNEQTIAPGKSISFTIRGIGSEDVPALLVKEKAAQRRITVLKGKKLRLPLIYTGKKDAVLVSGGTKAAPGKHIDIFPERQLDESFRTLELPAGTDVNALSLFELANGSAVSDRSVPFRVLKEGGKLLLKFRVPGINPSMGGGVVWRDGAAWEAWNKKRFLTFSQYPCRLLFCKGGKIDMTIPEGPGELIHNGSFTKLYAADPTIPDGYRNQFMGDRNRKFNNLSFMNPGVRLVWGAKARRNSSFLMITTRLERGVKYNFSTKVSCTNPAGNWVVINMAFYDAAGKALGRSTDIRINDDRKALPLALRSRSFYPPANAVRGEICLRVYDHQQEMKIYNVSLQPEPYRAQARTPEELLRNELVSGFVPGLDLIEKLDFSTVTPHRKFFPDPAEKFPKLLYLTGNTGSFIVKQAHRRHLIELCQRAKFEFTYIPLLRKIASAQGGGRWHFNFADTLEPYTLMRLKNLKKRPEAVMISQADFRYIPEETVNMLKKWRAAGTPLIFFNCQKVPALLRGKKVPVPARIFDTLPAMRKVSSSLLGQNVQFYEGGRSFSVIWNTGEFEYLKVHGLPFVPADKAQETVPNIYGAEYPYWEYFYLAQLKVLRAVSRREGTVTALKALPGALTVKSAEPCKVIVKTTLRDYYGRVCGRAESSVSLKKGVNTFAPPMPSESPAGGISIVDFKICSASGKELDCGAFKVDTPALPLEITMNAKEGIFSRGKPVTFTVKSLPGVRFECEIVDTEGRSVWKKSGTENTFSAPLHFPYTRLYNLYVRAEHQGKSALLQKEFALESAPLEPYDVDAAVWMNRPAYSRLVRDLGFNLNYSNFGLYHMRHGSLRAMVTDGCEPVSFGSGKVLNRTQRVYRGDAVTDPCRNPCFSDPVRRKAADKELASRLEFFYARYFGVRRHIVADEADLGRSVCFSDSCLKAFRVWLKGRYTSLAELNSSWGTSFKKWDEVTPVQFKELKDRERLARYVEHKLFMNLVFARDWVGATGEGIARAMPGSVAGLSGTQEPGFSYDWVQMMKYNPFLMYYGGNQVNAVLDFAPEGSQHGQWLGYTNGFTENEVHSKGRIWQDIFRGANLICKYSCESFRGDVTATPNARFFAEAVREIRSGAGARILRGKELGRDVGILYSQLSLLCSFSNVIGRQNQLNSWNSWPALLTDLGVRYRMISYEDLEKRPPECKVMVLPAAVSLSKNQLANLKKFAETGGTVIADFAAGWYDGHGNRAKDGSAESFFGIDRSRSVLFPADSPQYKGLAPGEGNLRVTDGKAALNSGKEPLVITKRHGKGKAVLLNLFIGSYYTIKLGGVGGEEATAQSGMAAVQQAVRELTSPFIRSVCKAPFELSGVKGAMIFLRRDGVNHYAGILPVIKDVPRYKDLKAVAAEAKFPVKGHLYLMREGRYLGYSDRCKLNLRSGEAVLISILPEKVEKVLIKAPGSVKCGEVCTIEFSASGGKGAHVFHVEVRRPDGTLPFGYQWNAYTSRGRSRFQFAANDQPGAWTITVRNVDTGITARKTLLLKK